MPTVSFEAVCSEIVSFEFPGSSSATLVWKGHLTLFETVVIWQGNRVYQQLITSVSVPSVDDYRVGLFRNAILW